MRLILQDGDSKRGLRLKDGTFSIGSAESCKITLTAEGVAEHHADLIVQGSSVQIEASSEEHEVLVGGDPAQGAVELDSGQSFAIGEARFELDKADAAPAAPKQAKASAARGRAGASPRPAAGKLQRVERSARKPRGKSFPTWLILMFSALAVLIGYKMFGVAMTVDDSGGFSEKTSRIRIEESLVMSDADAARKELDMVFTHRSEMSPEWIKIFEGLEVKVGEMGKETNTLASDLAGNAFVDKLKKYKGRYLQTNKRPEAREFVRRADRFLKEHKNHPDAAWVSQQRKHFARYAKPEELATLEDLLTEVHFLADGRPRDYITARARIAEFQERTDEGADELAARLTEMAEEEKEYYEEHVDVAAGLWERDNKPKALGKLMVLVSGLSNPAYSDDCARRITEMPGVLNALQGYKKEQPFFLKKCANANANFAAFLKKNDLD